MSFPLLEVDGEQWEPVGSGGLEIGDHFLPCSLPQNKTTDITHRLKQNSISAPLQQQQHESGVTSQAGSMKLYQALLSCFGFDLVNVVVLSIDMIH